jgi:hypothetical protein
MNFLLMVGDSANAPNVSQRISFRDKHELGNVISSTTVKAPRETHLLAGEARGNLCPSTLLESIQRMSTRKGSRTNGRE